MKNVLLLVHDDDGQEARYQTALDLTRAIGGHLTCLDLAYVPPFPGCGCPEGAYAMAELMTEEVARESVNKGRLVARLAHEDVSWDWRDAKGEVVASLRKAADWADVIVVSRHIDTSMIDMRRTTAELVVKSGKPVIAVPPTCDRLDLSSALVAWDGSACAAKALKAAIPLLVARQTG